VSKKTYFLVCNCCRWSTRDANIPDTTSPTGPWTEPQNPEAAHLEEIAEYFRMLALREKTAKEKKYVHKSKFLAAGRHGVAHLLPKRFPIQNPEEMGKAIPPPPYTAPTFGIDELPELDDEFYNEELIPAKLTVLSQRIGQPETQPIKYSGLLPTRKHLLVKRSLRCRVCERNISKPEYSPASIKFKIQLNAYYHVPHVRLMKPLEEPLLPGTKTRIVLRIANPTQFPTTIKFLPFAFVPLKKDDLNMLKDLESSSAVATTDSSLSLTPQTQIVKEISVLPIRNENFTMNCILVPPENELILPPRDETSDFDEFAETPDFNDNPKFIPWRKANKAAVFLDIERLTVKQPEGADDPPILGLTIEYDYTNTIAALENKSASGPQKVRIQAHLLIDLSQTYN
jgi:dynactin-4